MTTDQETMVGGIGLQSILYPISDITSTDYPKPVQWGEPQDSCNLTKVRLVHLDGSSVKAGQV